ncbi:MAG: YbaK/EbsC family protein [Clostridia bacterium]|nr:YbaK/EbsC family protein [Clostridia bacterium]
MSIQKVKGYFAMFDMQNKIRELADSSATVQLAALALGTKEERIAKTLSFWVNDVPILIVTAGDVKIDNAKYRAFFGQKAKMLGFDEVEQLVGHGVGGVCPFAINDGVKTYLDDSLKRFETIFPACGSANSAIELTPQELQDYCQNFVAWIDVCKLKEQNQ